MATYNERNGRWSVQIRKRGFKSRAATFPTRTEAEQWAAIIEAKMHEERNRRMTETASESALPMDIAILPRYNVEQIACGIYFLFKGNECVYVGQSKQVHWRVREHTTKRHGNKDFDSYSWIPVSLDQLDQAELHYIQMLQPRLNDKHAEIAKLERRLKNPNLTVRQRAEALDRLRASRRSAKAGATSGAT